MHTRDGGNLECPDGHGVLEKVKILPGLISGR
jgi:hypothetical protein